MEELALPVGRDRGRPRLGDEPVHVPLDVVDRRAREDSRSARRRCGRRPRAARSRGPAAGGSPSARGPGRRSPSPGWARNRSLSGFTISGSIHRPKSMPRAWTSRASASMPPGSLRRSTVQSPSDELSLSRRPNQPSSSTNSSTPRSFALRRDPDDPVVVEVEVGRLPVVEHDRPRPVAPRATRHPLPVQAVEASDRPPRPSPDHAMTASGVVNAAPGSRRQAKASGWMPRRSARGPERVDLHFGQEVAGVDEAAGLGLAGVLGRRGPAQGEERAVLGALTPRAGSDGLAAVDERPLVRRAAPAPTSR